MRKLFVPLIVFCFLSCDNGGMEFDQSTLFENGNNPFIGTWETSGDFVVEGDQRTYNSTLTFINETEYTVLIEYKSKQGTFHLTDEEIGTYSYDEQFITGTYSYSQNYHNGNPPATGGPYNFQSRPYKFINKNILESHGPGLDMMYITKVTYKRK